MLVVTHAVATLCNWVFCHLGSPLAGGTPAGPPTQIILPSQQSSGSYRAQWCLTWLALNLMNLKAI